MNNNDIVNGFDEETSDFLSIRLDTAPGVAACLVASLKGQVDNYTCPFLQRSARKMIDAGFLRLILVLREVDYVSSKAVVKLHFRPIPNGLEICVRNNVPFTRQEKNRIDEKLAIAKRFNSLAEAYTQSEDNSEGAGLGIVMTLFMLRNLGLDQDGFTIRTVGGETPATLTLKRAS